MAFRPNYGMPPFPHYQQAPQQIVFGQMRMPGQHHQSPQRSQEPTPVFVGNISEKCSDEFIQKILNECGTVASWKRIKGHNGRLQGFGFCNFADLEGTLRALRILHDFHLGDKKLTVKAEEKVRSELRKTAIENRKRQGKKDLKLKEDELPADEDDLKKDEEIRLKILHWMETDHKELFSITEDGEISEETKKPKDEQKSSEHKSSASSKKDDRNRRRRSKSRDGRSSRRSRSVTPRNKKSRRSRSSSGSTSSSSSSGSSRSSSYSSRSRSRSPIRNKSSKRRRSPSRSSEDSEDAMERRQMKQIMKQKEQAYHSRLKRWESRERQMSKKYDREERKEYERKKQIQKEHKKLKTFLEDYEDERDDPKFFKKSLFFQRKRDFEKEREADQKDRLQEAQEIEELKKQIMLEVENGQTIDVDEEAMKRHKQKEEDARRKMRADSGSPNPHQPLGQTANGAAEETESSDEEAESQKDSEQPVQTNQEPVEEPMEVTSVAAGAAAPKPSVAPIVISSNSGGWKAIGSSDGKASTSKTLARPVTSDKPKAPKRVASVSPAPMIPIAQRLNGVFGNDDEDDDIHKRKKMKPFQITREERMQVMSEEEKKALSKSVIKKIPQAKDELFLHAIEWDQLDAQWMKDRVCPWIMKKTAAFLGEEDALLCDFICEQLAKRIPPEQLLKDVAVIIEEDAEMFVCKLWRLLIYEGQARRLGIT